MILDGPRLEPRAGGPARQLVVFLHGYGADGNDLIGIGREWQALLPNAAFVSPHAPEPCGGAPMGRQWFGLTFRDPDERWRGVTRAAPALNEFLDAELARLKVAPEKFALVGFSQGTMMALHVGLRRKTAPAAIVGYSGLHVPPESQEAENALTEISVRPPVLLVHGAQDDLIPVQALFIGNTQLAAADVPVEWHVSQGIGHGIDGEGLRLGGSSWRGPSAPSAEYFRRFTKPWPSRYNCSPTIPERERRQQEHFRERRSVTRSLAGPRAQCGLSSAELLPAVGLVMAGHDQGGVPGARAHRRPLRQERAQPEHRDRLPSVVSLKTFVRPARHPAFTRFNVFLRDRFSCQYCGSRDDLTFDHLLPRSRGGHTTWENVVAACSGCNLRKGGLVPTRSGMWPSQMPYQPTVQNLHRNGRLFPPNYLHQSWLDYLYWDTELDP